MKYEKLEVRIGDMVYDPSDDTIPPEIITGIYKDYYTFVYEGERFERSSFMTTWLWYHAELHPKSLIKKQFAKDLEEIINE